MSRTDKIVSLRIDILLKKLRLKKLESELEIEEELSRIEELKKELEKTIESILK